MNNMQNVSMVEVASSKNEKKWGSLIVDGEDSHRRVYREGQFPGLLLLLIIRVYEDLKWFRRMMVDV